MDPDEADALLPDVRAALGDSPLKADIFDLEQAIASEVSRELYELTAAGDLTLKHILDDHFLRELHRRLYEGVWQWAGVYTRRERTLGVEPTQIAESVRSALGNLYYRWTVAADLDARACGLLAHADLVRIHPFVDGNGRTTRLFGELVFLATQDGETIHTYDWEIEKGPYIRALRNFDATGDIASLLALVPLIPFE